MKDDFKNRTGEPAYRRTGEISDRTEFAPPPTRPIADSCLLDLRGVACPLNFVKTKIQLDKMQTGQVLEIWIDDGEAIESVPPSVVEEGHEILQQVKVENYFKVLISKSN